MILLTGASGGIGSEILEDLSKIDDVLAIYNSSKPKNISISNIKFEKVDISDPNEILSFFNRNKKNLKNVTLVNLAAVSIDGLLANYDLEDWEKVIRVNLSSNFLFSRYLIPIMIKDKWGRIIHVSSTNSAIGAGAYSSSKSGLEGLSKALSREYARYGITSNIIKLGVFNTGMFHALSDKNQKAFLDRIPSKKLGKALNVTNAISFLINSEFVNGASITIDGGAS
jgi:NAD(P)-dependent dehydrogenase (short-subunit alcohol dehydrogenase family)